MASSSSSSPFSSLNPSNLLTSSTSRHPPAAAAAISFPRRSFRGKRMTAAAAATGKKYKGTAMREERLTEMIERKVAEAIEACDGDDGKDSDGCKVAWDEVEEVSQAKADLRRKLVESSRDPLESFCEENPETDECRIYED